MHQCAFCKRKYKQEANYSKHATICALVNSQSLKASVAREPIYSDNEPFETQAPGNAQLFAVVHHLVGIVKSLQIKVSKLEQLAYIRKPRPDVKTELAQRATQPSATFRAWIMRDIVSNITRATLVECVFAHSNLADAICKIIMARISAKDMPPFYADRSKAGSFFVYDADTDADADADADADTNNNNNNTNILDPAAVARAVATAAGAVGGTPRQRWQPLTARAFRWMVDAIHRQLLGEYRGWAVDANDNSDEFIETSMRFGAIIVGGNMEWSSFMAKLKTRMWTLTLDAQSPVASHP
jgi:hypothetical protein